MPKTDGMVSATQTQITLENKWRKNAKEKFRSMFFFPQQREKLLYSLCFSAAIKKKVVHNNKSANA